MHAVTIQASISRIPWPRLRISKTIPSRWSELDPAQAWDMINAAMIMESPQLYQLRTLLALPARIWDELTDDQLYDMVRMVDGFKIDPHSTVPVCNRMIIPGCAYEWYMPGANFKNVSGLEYAILHDDYRQYLETGSEDDQARMICSTLRPGGTHPDRASDPRVPLRSRDQALTWLPYIQSLPRGIKAYITLIVSANIQLIHDAYGSYIFKADQDSSIDPLLSDDGSLDDGIDFGWWGTYMRVAEDGVFGPLAQVHQTDIHSICQYLVIKRQQYLAEKKAMDELKNRTQ